MTEHQNLEWKESWRDEYLRWICGFANAQGGTLVIGKNDRGENVGVKQTQRWLQEIPNKVRDLLGIMVHVNLKTEAGRDLVEIVVEPYPCLQRLKGKHPSQPFNPDIANAFFRAGMIEAWGRGIERMLEACRTANLSEPEFRYEQTGLWVEFRFPASAEMPMTKTPVMIVEFLRMNPNATLAEVAAAVGKSLRVVERASSKLVNTGKLRFVGPRKGGHWEVKV